MIARRRDTQSRKSGLPRTPSILLIFGLILDVALDLTPGATKAQLEGAMKGHILAEGQLIFKLSIRSS